MAHNLNFSTLIPEHDTFTDQDGTQYDFKSKTDFGAVDYARVKRLSSQIELALRQMSADGENEAAAQTLDNQAREFIGLILPQLPPERVEAMTLGQKSKVIEWWTERNRGGQGRGVGEARADQLRQPTLPS